MKIVMNIWGFFQTNILTQPAFFIGFIVLLGYILMKKRWYECLAGFLKATVGYFILTVGSGGLTNTFRPILAGLSDRFGLNAVVIDPYFGQVAAQNAVENLGRSFSMMMSVILVAFLVNIVLVLFRKWTKIRMVFLTGHIMVLQASTALWVVLYCFPHLQDIKIVFLMGGLLGVYWSVFSNLTVEPAQHLTEGANFTLGHSNMLGFWLADKLSSKVGNKSKKVEDMKLPGFLSIFKENLVSTSILMLVFFGTIMLIIGKENMQAIDDTFTTQSFLFYILQKCLYFAVYLTILLQGVGLFVNELTYSFNGISSTFLKGAIPAIDCPGLFGYTHGNVITLGFLFGALGQFIAIVGLIVFKSPIFIITGFVPVFFDNAVFATIANKNGGVRGLAVTTFISGIIQVLGGAIAVAIFGMKEYGGWIGNFDWDTMWPVIGLLMKNLQYVGIAIVILGMLIIPQLQYKKRKDDYFLIVEDYEKYAEKNGIILEE